MIRSNVIIKILIDINFVTITKEKYKKCIPVVGNTTIIYLANLYKKYWHDKLN